jgi:hypothetical protein
MQYKIYTTYFYITFKTQEFPLSKEYMKLENLAFLPFKALNYLNDI